MRIGLKLEPRQAEQSRAMLPACTRADDALEVKGFGVFRARVTHASMPHRITVIDWHGVEIKPYFPAEQIVLRPHFIAHLPMLLNGRGLF
ncbi:hypothetical protein D3C78_1626220 [compost metagenome]